jgi:hypothetical protein
VLAELRAQMRARNFLLRAELAFENMVKSVTRQLTEAPQGPPPFPPDFAAHDFADQRRTLRSRRRAVERAAVELVRATPVYEWWTSQRGLGALGLAQILGITGDLNAFPTPAKLWKYLSLHVVDGHAARRARGAASRGQGFSPFRRAVMHQIGDALVKLNAQPWRGLYDARKAYELERLPPDPGRQGWAHKRALRYMEKRLLRELWRAWRQAAAAP